MDNTPFSEEDKSRTAIHEINVPETPKRTLSGLLEDKKKVF